MDRDLDTLDPEPVIAKLKGVDREIRPVVAVNIPRLARAVQPFVDQIFNLPEEILQRPTENAVAAIGFVLELVVAHGERALEAISAATRIPLAEVNELELDELIDLGFKAWEVNSDFFIRKLAPLLAVRALARSGAGLTR